MSTLTDLAAELKENLVEIVGTVNDAEGTTAEIAELVAPMRNRVYVILARLEAARVAANVAWRSALATTIANARSALVSAQIAADAAEAAARATVRGLFNTGPAVENAMEDLKFARALSADADRATVVAQENIISAAETELNGGKPYAERIDIAEQAGRAAPTLTALQALDADQIAQSAGHYVALVLANRVRP
jgi:phage protein D